MDVNFIIEGEVDIAVEEDFGGLDACELGNSFGEGWGFAAWGDKVWGWGCKGACDVAAVGAKVEDVWYFSLDILTRYIS